MNCLIRANVRGWICATLAALAFSGVVRAQDGAAEGTPPNDGCRDQIEVFNGNIAFSNELATTDGPEEPQACNFSFYSDIGHDIWYRYKATCTGQLTLDLCASTFDTKVAVYDGCLQCPVVSPPIGCNDDGPCGVRSFLTVPVEQDDCYTIRLGGYFNAEGTGVMTLHCDTIVTTGACCGPTGLCLGTLTESQCADQNGIWHEGTNCSTFTCPIPPPLNDNCTDCVRILTGVAYESSTIGASGITTTCAPGDTKDVWHCWTADCTGRVRIGTCGSSFDTTLSVYDSCNGDQIICNNDGCQSLPEVTRSQLDLDVTAGTTYYIRVAGVDGQSGSYRIQVDPCRNACCINQGFSCQVIPTTQCTNGGGTPAGPGTLCGGDSNQNGIFDVCEAGCPAATIGSAEPPGGTVDARQPHPMNTPALRQGIGAPGVAGVLAEPIHIQLSPQVTGAEDCFSLCETSADPLLGPNEITSVTYHGAGVYRISLAHAITMGAVTTIRYDGNGSFVSYISHPGNTNSDSFAVPSDILELIDHLNGVRIPPLTMYQCDLNRSLACNPADIITQIDLLNGAGDWDPWNGTQKPSNSSCP